MENVPTLILATAIPGTLGAHRARRWLAAGSDRWHCRLSGGFLLGAGVGLALARHGD